MRTFWIAIMLMAAALTLTACGGGGSTPTFNLTFEPPGGTGFAEDQVGDLRLVSSVIQNFTFAMGVSVNGRVPG